MEVARKFSPEASYEDKAWAYAGVVSTLVPGGKVVKAAKLGRLAKKAKYFIKGTSKLSGKWITANESMSEASRAYQRFITGTDKVWLQNGVKFDGVKNGILIEAKGSYANFVNKKTGQFYSWFNSADDLVSQARRQLAASEGAGINWYFSDQASLYATKVLFKNEGISGINLIFRPHK